MATKTQIINRALALIGADSIASIDDGSSEAVAAGALYDGVIEDLLSRHPWRFARAQAQLSRLTDTPEARFDAAYQLPSDALAVETVLVNSAPIEFDRLEDKVLCDATTSDVVVCEYLIANDESKWPGYFTACAVQELASIFAIPIGDREDLAERFEKRALRAYANARSLDSRGRTTRRMPISRFRSVRNGSR